MLPKGKGQEQSSPLIWLDGAKEGITLRLQLGSLAMVFLVVHAKDGMSK